MNYRRKTAFIAGALLCLSLGSYAQSVSVKMQGVSVKKAIAELQQKSGYSFVYIAGEIDTEKTVSIDAKNLSDAVNQILKGQNVSYEIKGKSIVVKKSSIKTLTSSDKKVEIKGIVKDTKGEPVIGATVMVKGTTNGTITDFDGNFTLNAAEGASIEISYIGFKTQQLLADAGKSFNIVLKEDTEVLDEVVVVGYGTQKKVNLTGAVASVKMDEILGDRPITSALSALEGSVPGLQINKISGKPGVSINTNIGELAQIRMDL